MTDPDAPRPLVLPAHDPDAIAAAAAAIRAGRLVAFPTETVYGLGANALDADAVARIFAAKGRPSYNPLIVHVPDVEAAAKVATVTPLARRLAAAFWPGALTLVMPRTDAVPDCVTAGLDSVGVRVPAHPAAAALLAACGVPLAAPSANPFTRVSPTTARHVVELLGERVDVVLDGGPTTVGIESTVLDVRGERPVLLRPGGVSVAAIEAVVGPVERAAEPAGDAPRRSPGALDRHYAPRASLVAFAAADRRDVGASLAAAAAAGRKEGVLAFDLDGLEGAALAIAMPRDAVGYARELFAALHRFDEARCERVHVERPPATDAWEAVADRLRRAGLASGARRS